MDTVCLPVEIVTPREFNQRALIDESGAPLGVNADKLLSHGLDDYYKWIDLVVGAIVNAPNYTPPKL